MKYDPESPAMTDSCVERHQTTAQCFLFPGLDLQRWSLWWHESFYRSFRRLGNTNGNYVNVDIYIWVCKESSAYLCLWIQYFSQYWSVFVFAFLYLCSCSLLCYSNLHIWLLQSKTFYKILYLDFQSVQILSLFPSLTPSFLLPSVIGILSRKHTLLL